jgi:hypothetical protein
VAVLAPHATAAPAEQAVAHGESVIDCDLVIAEAYDDLQCTAANYRSQVVEQGIRVFLKPPTSSAPAGARSWRGRSSVAAGVRGDHDDRRSSANGRRADCSSQPHGRIGMVCR